MTYTSQIINDATNGLREGITLVCGPHAPTVARRLMWLSTNPSRGTFDIDAELKRGSIHSLRIKMKRLANRVAPTICHTIRGADSTSRSLRYYPSIILENTHRGLVVRKNRYAASGAVIPHSELLTGSPLKNLWNPGGREEQIAAADAAGLLSREETPPLPEPRNRIDFSGSGTNPVDPVQAAGRGDHPEPCPDCKGKGSIVLLFDVVPCVCQ